MPSAGVFVDTNVLLSASAPARRTHDAARFVLEQWPASRDLYTSGQVLREYLVVATRPQEGNGLGLPVGAAVANVRELRSRMRFLEEDEETLRELLRLLASAPARGRTIHDAAILATAIRHGVGALLTENVDDFRRYAPRLEIVDLASLV